jgi:hypothetical protein
MRKSLTLTEAAILARMAPAVVINERKRGNLPVVDSKSGGSLRLVDTLLLMLYGYLKQQTSSNREMGKQARAATDLACEAIFQYINGGLL